jgi:hypothetical protein
MKIQAWRRGKINNKCKIKGDGGGQECPPHMPGYSAVSAALKPVCLWYNFNSCNTTLSIRNFNNLKSFGLGFRAVELGRSFQPNSRDSQHLSYTRNRDIFAERNGH